MHQQELTGNPETPSSIEKSTGGLAMLVAEMAEMTSSGPHRRRMRTKMKPPPINSFTRKLEAWPKLRGDSCNWNKTRNETVHQCWPFTHSYKATNTDTHTHSAHPCTYTSTSQNQTSTSSVNMHTYWCTTCPPTPPTHPLPPLVHAEQKQLSPNLLHSEVVLQPKARSCHCPVHYLPQQRDNGNEAVASKGSELKKSMNKINNPYSPSLRCSTIQCSVHV